MINLFCHNKKIQAFQFISDIIFKQKYTNPIINVLKPQSNVDFYNLNYKKQSVEASVVCFMVVEIEG